MLPARARTVSVLVLSVTGLSALAFAGPGAVDTEVAATPATVAVSPPPPQPPVLVRVGVLDRLAETRSPVGEAWVERDLDASLVTLAADAQPLVSLVGDDASDDGVHGSGATGDAASGSGASGDGASGSEVSGDGASGSEVSDDGVDGSGDEAAADDEPAFVTADGDRVTAARIHAFLDGRGAPLAEHADAIVAAGIEHDVDPRLVVGIAIAESNGGERLPPGSHNAWGWSGSGSHGLARWSSWDASIDDFTERLGRLYDTSDVGESFARTYCPPNWRWWLETVTWAKGAI